MKKSLFAMGMLAMAVASCTNEEVVDIPSSKGISFNNPYVGTSVRANHPGVSATQTVLESIKGKDNQGTWQAGSGFYVYGGYNNTPVFTKTHVTYNNTASAWEYSPLSYWVNGEVYKFIGYAPDMVVTPTYAWGKSDDSNDATLNFTGITINGSNQKDFVIGNTDVVKPTDKSTPGAQSITLKHALSMIKVTLKNDFRNDVNLIIKNFAINGIKTQGNFSFGTSSPKAGDWTITSEAESQSSFTHAGMTLTARLDTYSNEFIVLPQLVEENTMTVTFTASLKDKNGQPIAIGAADAKTDGEPDDGADGEDIVKNAKDFTMKIPKLESGWAINNRYNYTATLNGASFGLKEITFGDPQVESWGNYGSDIDIDK